MAFNTVILRTVVFLFLGMIRVVKRETRRVHSHRGRREITFEDLRG